MISRVKSIEQQFELAKEKIIKGDLDTAIIELQEITKEAEESENYTMYLKCINALGVAYAGMENENMAMDFYLKGLTFAQVNQVPGWTHLFFNNIGARYQQLGDYREALQYYMKAEADLLSLGYDKQNVNAHFYVITYLNQSDCYRHINDVENAQRCINCAINYSQKYEIDYCDFAIAVVQAYLNWYSGNLDAVRADLDRLTAFAKAGSDSIEDYARNISELIQILSNMEEYDKVFEILGYFDVFVRRSESSYLRLQLAELYMDYYRNVDDLESYRDACVEHAEYYKDYKTFREQDDILALNVRIELQRAEVEIALAKKNA